MSAKWTEGRRLLEAYASIPPYSIDADNVRIKAVDLAHWCERNLPALLTAASERDAAVREVEELKAKLWRLENEGRYRIESIRSVATPWAVVDHKQNPPAIVQTFVTHLAAVEALHALAAATGEA